MVVVVDVVVVETLAVTSIVGEGVLGLDDVISSLVYVMRMFGTVLVSVRITKNQ